MAIEPGVAVQIDFDHRVNVAPMGQRLDVPADIFVAIINDCVGARLLRRGGLTALLTVEMTIAFAPFGELNGISGDRPGAASDQIFASRTARLRQPAIRWRSCTSSTVKILIARNTYVRTRGVAVIEQRNTPSNPPNFSGLKITHQTRHLARSVLWQTDDRPVALEAEVADLRRSPLLGG
jgi:hypothetical protein